MGESQDDFHTRLLDAAVDLMGRAGRGGAVQVRGGSMRPTLEPGDLLAVEFSPGRLRRGDLIVFRREDYLVVHRFVWRGHDASGPVLRCRGDGVRSLDPPIAAVHVVGRVFAVRHGETWRGMRTGTGRLYEWCIANHDAVWAVCNRFARKLAHILARLGLSVPLSNFAWSIDRRLLGLAHRVLFRAVYPVIDQPHEAAELSGTVETRGQG